MRWPTGKTLLLLSSLAISFLSLVFYIQGQDFLVVDDAFIFFRYARNVAQGNGLVFNLGERVEGVSSLLWTMMLVPFELVHISTDRAAPLLCVILGLTVLCVLPRLSACSRSTSNIELIDYLPSLLLLTNTSFLFWSSSGMESVLFSLILVMAMQSYLASRFTDRVRGLVLWLSLALLSRPEAALLVTTFIVALVWDVGFSKKKKLLTLGCGLASTLTLITLFRISYFGDVFPNTYYAKVGLPLREALIKGFAYTMEFVSQLFSVAEPVSLIIIPVIGVGLCIATFRSQTLRPLALLLLLQTVFILKVGGDWMPLGRMWLHVLPIFYVLLCSTLFAFSKHLPKLKRPLYGILGILLIGNLMFVSKSVNQPDGLLSRQVRSNSQPYADLTTFLNANANSTDRVALMDIGLIGYRTGLPIIDIVGLTDREIARSPGGSLDKKYDPELVLARNPRFFVLRSDFEIDSRFLNSARFKAEFALVNSWSLSGADRPSTIKLYQKKTSTLGAKEIS